MVLPVRMSEVEVVFLRSRSDAVMEAIHHSGMMHIDQLSQGPTRTTGKVDEDPSTRAAGRRDAFTLFDRGQAHTTTMGKKLENVRGRLNRLSELLGTGAPEPPSFIKKMFQDRPALSFQPEVRGPGELLNETGELLSDTMGDATVLSERLSDSREREAALLSDIELLERLPGELGIGELMRGDGKAIITLGTTRDATELEVSLGDASGSVSGAVLIDMIHLGGGREKGTELVLVVHHRKVGGAVEKVLKGHLFTPEVLSKDLPDMPVKDALKELGVRLNAEREKAEDAMTGLRKLYSHYHTTIERLDRELVTHMERQKVLSGLGHTERTLMISGWVETREADRFRRLLEKAAGGYAQVYISATRRDDDEVPVLLRNNPLLKPFEAITLMYGTPRYSSIDPTFLVGPLFTLFFGLMLGDAGYGLLIFLGSIFLWAIPGRHDRMMRTFGYMGVLMGLSTMFFGLIFGSFFGDLLPRLIYPVAGIGLEQLYPTIQVGPAPLPYDALREPLYFMLISLALGVATLNLSILVGLVQDILKRDVRKIFLDRLSLLILQAGGIPLLASELLGLVDIGTTLTYIFAFLAISGFVLLCVSKGKMFILGLFDVTGYIGDWMSFLRLMALGLSTTGLALTINVVTQLLLILVGYFLDRGGAFYALVVVVALIAVIVLVAAHVMNTALQLLGSAIHSLRLQYIEFFGRFYDAGGESFEPLSVSGPDELRGGGGL